MALNGFLLSPLFLYELNVGEGGPDTSLLFLLPASLLGLCAAQTAVRRVWLSHAILAPFYLFVAADLYVILTYRTRLSSSMMLVIVQNFGDARDYLDAHAPRVFGALGLLAVFYVLALRRVRTLRVKVPRISCLASAASLALLLFVVSLRVGGVAYLLPHDRSTPFGFIAQGLVAYSVYQESILDAHRARSFVFGARRAEPPSEPETYVLVIGESSRRDHWGLYGYARDTTPELARVENLVVFDDVLSQAALTQASVPLIITRGTIVDTKRMNEERSLVSLFHEVGFRTYWMSTQRSDPWTGIINRYAKEADVERFYERRHDGVLVEALREALDDSAGTRAKRFIVLHTMGSHFAYPSRYPEAFAVFPTKGPRTSREQLVNEYDNTVRYGDHVLAEVIRVLSGRPGIRALLYVSDHGENLRDDSRNLFGHPMNNEYDIPVPMFVWYSDGPGARVHARLGALRENARRPISTRAVFYSLADIAGITLDDPGLSQLSVLSPSMDALPRMALAFGHTGPVDFDRWLEQNGRAGSREQAPHSPDEANPTGLLRGPGNSAVPGVLAGGR